MARLGAEPSWPAQHPPREAPEHGEFALGAPNKLQTRICREEAEMHTPGVPAKLPEPGAHRQQPVAQGQGPASASVLQNQLIPPVRVNPHRDQPWRTADCETTSAASSHGTQRGRTALRPSAPSQGLFGRAGPGTPTGRLRFQESHGKVWLREAAAVCVLGPGRAEGSPDGSIAPQRWGIALHPLPPQQGLGTAPPAPHRAPPLPPVNLDRLRKSSKAKNPNKLAPNGDVPP